MANKKKTNSPINHSLSNDKETIGNDNDVKNKSIIVCSLPNIDGINWSDYSHVIGIDGHIDTGSWSNESSIMVCLIGDASHTQLVSFAKLIKELKSKGAGSIKRYDEINTGKINPSFNLSHTLIKYGIR